MTMHGDAANAKACAKVLVCEWLSRYDHVRPRISVRVGLWMEVCSLMGIARDPKKSYHTQRIGKIERIIAAGIILFANAS